MCGINGIFSKKKINNINLRLNRMNDSLKHRGPNASGVVFFNNNTVGLGHRRLSIIDLDDRSNQPFSDKENNDVIVFNGEIYNYLELKKEISYHFKTNSDTEVLYGGIKQNGIDWINKCNGMFAFCYYNALTNDAIICRDRFGIKPLYYYADEEKFIFSSEIKGILNSGLVEVSFNYDAIDEYLGYRYTREPFTFFQNIYQLPAGCYLNLHNDMTFEIQRYWDLPVDFNMEIEFDEEKIYSRFKEEINLAIKRRMISDVELGTYLSGGIDSSLISAIVAKNNSKRLNTYTIGFKELNEFRYARMVADKYNTEHHEITMRMDEYLSLMSEVIQYKDAPLGVPNEIPLALMSKVLKEKITVVLSGEGADELMGGYGKIFRSGFDFQNIDREKCDDFYKYFIDKYEYVPRQLRDEMLNIDVPLRDYFDKKVKGEFEQCPNEENVFRFFHKYHIKGLLQRVDITTMYASVEARVPFLDHELVEFTYKSVPYDLKLKWKSIGSKMIAKAKSSSEYSELLDEPKYLIRKMGLEYLPEEVVTRKKMGFPVPLNDWYANLSKLAEELLNNTIWLKKDCVKNLISECTNNTKAGQLLWMFINIEMFRKIYFEKDWRY